MKTDPSQESDHETDAGETRYPTGVGNIEFENGWLWLNDDGSISISMWFNDFQLNISAQAADLFSEMDEEWHVTADVLRVLIDLDRRRREGRENAEEDLA